MTTPPGRPHRAQVIHAHTAATPDNAQNNQFRAIPSINTSDYLTAQIGGSVRVLLDHPCHSACC